MIQPIDLQADNVFAYRIEGEVRASEMRPLVNILETKLQQHKKMRLYAEYVGVEDVSLTAVWEDLKFNFSHLTDFEKAAIVTDRDWIGLSAGLVGLIPGLDVKFFTFAEQEQARQWVKR
ncbi:STAS/SEC14 domain-containing protein [Spirosoma taeanense]|uniref:STAS/SEC14 domain-containing protein n=1 Tax=Spirosoma taeanense TaxID=2735870 RepID=A0A6M5Y642_9BACT|nr:STAS/SEC14 domain-containing protein [Spirosoma taeanense]QJW89918.1 STAS/SEC14 domain-containing protein [Spirosoma taeanense]